MFLLGITGAAIVGWLLLGVVVGVAESATFEVGPHGVAMVVVLSTSFVVLRYALRCLDRLGNELGRRSGGQATAAEFVGSYGGGRVGGLDRRDSFGLGASLSARGALQIVVATVGLSLGVIGPTAYPAILVMALAIASSKASLGCSIAHLHRMNAMNHRHGRISDTEPMAMQRERDPSPRLPKEC